jgi:glucose-1-phosphate thymidylyltransferase
MKIVIPMAGIGKRMRPHTLTTPKPMLPIAGKPIVQRLVEDIAAISGEKISEIGFVIGNFGRELEENLMEIAGSIGAEAKIYYQEEALGTAHAVFCAEEMLQGPVIVAFADTLFKADLKLEKDSDGVIWVQKVDDPSHFGVVTVNDQGIIDEFVEKPEKFISDLAIIGIYYFKNAEEIRDEIKFLIDNDKKDRGEFQITDALKNMMLKGKTFLPGKVEEWLDCGNKNITVQTNSRYLSFLREKEENLISDSASLENSVLIDPVFLGDNVIIKESVIGPNVSVSSGSELTRSTISDCIIGRSTKISGAILHNSMIGNNVTLNFKPKDLSLGDYNTIDQ